jgi:amidase
MNRVLIDAGDEMKGVDYVNATQALRGWARRIVAFWDEYDLVLTPTLAQPPPPVGALMDPDDPWGNFEKAWTFTPFTQVANVTGLPAVSVPLYWTDAGLPIGTQLIGRPAAEATLLRVSAQLEAARPWRERRPPVS